MLGHRRRKGTGSTLRVSPRLPYWAREKERVWMRCSNPECREVFGRIPSIAQAKNPCCSIGCLKAFYYLRRRGLTT